MYDVFIKKTLSILYSILTRKYTTGVLNHKKITRFESSDVKHAIYILGYRYDDMFIVLYIDMKVHYWYVKSQKKSASGLIYLLMSNTRSHKYWVIDMMIVY